MARPKKSQKQPVKAYRPKRSKPVAPEVQHIPEGVSGAQHAAAPTAETDAVKAAAAALKAAEKTATVAKKAAAKEKAKVKADRDKATAKAKEAATAKAKDASVKRELAPISKEINVRLAKAAQRDKDADDMRLAAAIQLASAKKLCTENKIGFKDWCDANVEQGYENTRKLVAIGMSDNPALALEDMRAGNRKANKKSRERGATGSSSTSYGTTGRAQTSLEQADTMFEGMDEKTTGAVLEIHAGKQGKVLIDKARVKKLTDMEKSDIDPSTLAGVKAAFDNLRATDKMALLKYAAEQTGFTVSSVLAEEVADVVDPLAIPEHMKRAKKG